MQFLRTEEQMRQRIKHDFVGRLFLIAHLEVIKDQRRPRSIIHKDLIHEKTRRMTHTWGEKTKHQVYRMIKHGQQRSLRYQQHYQQL